MARSGSVGVSLYEIVCNNVDYYVEFPNEDEKDCEKKKISGEVQRELVDGLHAVMIKKKEEIRREKKIRVEEAVCYDDKNVKSLGVKEGRNTVLTEVRKWEKGGVISSTVRRNQGVVIRDDDGTEKSEMEVDAGRMLKGCGGWPGPANECYFLELSRICLFLDSYRA